MSIFKSRESQSAGDMVIHAESVYARTAQREILGGFTVRFGQGEYVAIKGPSGSGKTVFAGLLAGLRPKGIDFNGSQISYRVDGQLLDPKVNIRDRHIGYVPQKPVLAGNLTVAENILLPTRLKGARPDKTLLGDVTDRLKLSNRMGDLAGNLSGGEQQRVAIARAFAFGPNVVILDEPTSALDQNLKMETNEMLGELAQLGQAIIAVTHEDTTASRVINLVDGRIESDLMMPLAS